MKVRVGSIGIVVVLLLSMAMIGGCPASTDMPDGITPSDNNGAGDSSGDNTPSGGPSSDDGTSDGSDAPAGDGSDGSADDGSTSGDGADGGDTGDSGTGDDSDTGDASGVLQGTFSGELTRVKHEAVVEGDWKLEEVWTSPFSVTFDEAGMPTAFVVPAYGETEGGIEFVVEINELGETVTLNESSGGHDVTLTATVVLANYGETSGRVVLNLEHSGQAIIEEEGTGVHVVEYELDGDNLLYSAQTNYEVELAGLVRSYWQVESEGTLSPE